MTATAKRARWVVRTGLGVGLAWAASFGGTGRAAEVSEGETISVTLEHQEASQGILSWGLSVTSESKTFRQEPEISSGEVRRGRIQFEWPQDQSMAFLWAPEAGRLYLDLNQNEDLTDDAEGVLSTELVGSDYQTFEGVRVPLETEAGRQRWLVDLHLHYYRDQVRVMAWLRSFLAGRLLLDGQEWQIGVVDRRSGRRGGERDLLLLLRAWEAREDSFNVHGGTLDLFAFPTNLFLQGRAYRVERNFDRQADPVRYRLELTRQPVELGALSFAGEFVGRALLVDGPWTVVLDAPAETMQVPVGTYEAYRVQVQKDQTVACLDVRWPDGGIRKKITVDGEVPARLVAGGPLTNSVTFRRRGGLLVLQYQLVGVGGESYRPLTQDRSNPPRFAIYKGARQIGAGKFEFG